MKNFFMIFFSIILGLAVGYFAGFKGLFVKKEASGITYKQVVEVMKVVCEDKGFSTTQAASLSNIAYADNESTTLEFKIDKSYFKAMPDFDLSEYVNNSDLYNMYDIILKSMSNELANNSLKLNEVKSVAVYEDTEFEQEVYYYLFTQGNNILIDWSSADYINHANTGVWQQNTCLGYRLVVEYDLKNFDDKKYTVKQASTVQDLDEVIGYSFVYQHVEGGVIKDCGYSDFGIKKNISGNIIKESTNGLILENIDLVNNKACFLKGSEGMFWYSNIDEQYISEISDDDTFQLVNNIFDTMHNIDSLPSSIYTTFCANK